MNYILFFKVINCNTGSVFPESTISPEKLITYPRTVFSYELRQGGASARRHFEYYHRNEVLIDLMNHSEARGAESSQSRLIFAISTGEWSAWIASQLSVGRLVYQGLHRLAKRVCAKWS
ncbi:MAG: hypothetical protein Q8S32_08945 [Burkholderiaceae bacterium]|nr:hypothetical protein [Burkholderiaceae bacterium]